MPLPADFTAKYQQLLGADYPAFLASFEQPVVKGFRLNPLKKQQQPAELSLATPIPYSRYGYFGSVNGHGVDHVTGLVYSQEPSAQFVAEVVDAQPGERVLDLAAAPGGKSTQLAGQMQGQGLLVANEIFFSRAKILSENLERFGVSNAIVSSMPAPDLALALPNYFDRVLLDAPCSGEGMFRKDAEAQTYWAADYPAACASRQKDILPAAIAMLKPGGRLVYSTCTFAPEEDEQLVDWLLTTYPEMRLLPITAKKAGIDDGRPDWASGNKDLTKTARLWPQHLSGEGHFVAAFEKVASEDAMTTQVKAAKPARLAPADYQLVQDFVQANLQDFPLDSQRLARFGDRIFLLPVDCPSLKKIKVLRAGLCLGTLKKNRFEPDHALALAIQPAQAKQQYALDLASQYAPYVHGEVLQLGNNVALKKGFVLVTANGNGIGWGKYVNGQLKNFFPKGLRF
ncbi:RsmF rRNA methyltransferase first C-terminal domain-containing protein [Leuconostocaceae bacterium ESL0958]|nr:RsmF rRNA methyltransferase first C-terminal domain-containing protein [Leuconostocaceae bacterium ESL0958]